MHSNTIEKSVRIFQSLGAWWKLYKLEMKTGQEDSILASHGAFALGEKDSSALGICELLWWLWNRQSITATKKIS